jgi:hypothetical protein
MNDSTNASESTPLTQYTSYQSGSSTSSEDSKCESNNKNNEFGDGDQLGRKLLACNGNAELEDRVMRRSLDIAFQSKKSDPRSSAMGRHRIANFSISRRSFVDDQSLFQKMVAMISLALLGLLTIFVLLQVSSLIVGPPSQPVGPYQLVEMQVRNHITRNLSCLIGIKFLLYLSPIFEGG